MKHISKKRTLLMACLSIAMLLLLGTLLLPLTATIAKADTASANNGNVYRYSQLKACTDGSGYADPQPLSVGDPLIGVQVAEITLANFSSTTEKDGKRYFLKTSPDVPLLSIVIKTDLDDLGGSGAWINSDSDTRIPDYGFIGNIGYGWLGISHTDFQGKTQTVCITDVFKKIKDGSSFVPAWFGSEGTYKISLCFETKRQTGSKKKWDFWPFKSHWEAIYGYENYRLDANFDIRNANSQVFVFDSTGNELLNGATCSGFTLDFANSHYLQINVKREVAVSTNELMESTDVRYNSVGVDQRTYSAPGIYTIEASNEITGAKTTRRILVVSSADQEGSKLLRSAAANRYSEFASLLTSKDSSEAITNPEASSGAITNPEVSHDSSRSSRNIIITIVGAAAFLIAAIIVTVVIVVRHQRKN